MSGQDGRVGALDPPLRRSAGFTKTYT